MYKEKQIEALEKIIQKLNDQLDKIIQQDRPGEDQDELRQRIKDLEEELDKAYDQD